MPVRSDTGCGASDPTRHHQSNTQDPLRQRFGVRVPDGVSESPGRAATDRRSHAPRQGDAGHADQVPYGTACPPLHRASSLV